MEFIWITLGAWTAFAGAAFLRNALRPGHSRLQPGTRIISAPGTEIPP
jgi:hypothetical protein